MRRILVRAVQVGLSTEIETRYTSPDNLIRLNMLAVAWLSLLDLQCLYFKIKASSITTNLLLQTCQTARHSLARMRWAVRLGPSADAQLRGFQLHAQPYRYNYPVAAEVQSFYLVCVLDHTLHYSFDAFNIITRRGTLNTRNIGGDSITTGHPSPSY